MKNNHISHEEYTQLSDSEKAGYSEHWEVYDEETGTYDKSFLQPHSFIQGFAKYKSEALRLFNLATRRIYIPIEQPKVV